MRAGGRREREEVESGKEEEEKEGESGESGTIFSNTSPRRTFSGDASTRSSNFAVRFSTNQYVRLREQNRGGDRGERGQGQAG